VLVFAADIFLVHSSCSEKKEVTLDELKGYAVNPANGLIQILDNGNYSFELVYRPKELLIAQEAGTNDVSRWDSIASELSRYDYFVLRISRNHREAEAELAADPASYMRLINYLNGGIAGDISMSVDGETLNVSDALFTPGYGSSNSSSILLVFDSHLTARESDSKIVFNDTQFDPGRHEFNFRFSSVQAVPTLSRRAR
jgi:hypothetical protein